MSNISGKKIVGWIKRAETLAFVVVFSALFFACPIQASAKATEANTKKIRVAYPIQEKLTERGPNGEYTGYTYEYLRKLAQLTGWEYEFVEVDGDINQSFPTLLKLLEKGEVDLMGGLLKSDVTTERYDFSGSSYGTVYCTLSVLADNNKVNEANLMSIEQLKIAVLKESDTYRKELESFCEANRINAVLLEYDTEEEQYQALRGGAADAMLGSDLSIKKGIRTVAKFGRTPYYFATTKGNEELLQKLNAALLQLEATEPYFSTRLYEQYFNQRKTPFYMSKEERKYVEDHPTIRILISSEIEPYQYKENGNYQGIAITVLEKFAKQAGFYVEYVERDTTISMVEQIEKQNFDFMVGVPYDYDFAEKYGLLLSTPYIETQTTLFSKNTVNMSNLQDKTVALTQGSEPREEFKNNKILYVDSLKECIKAVNKGDADFGYGNSYSIGYYLSQGAYQNIISVPLFNQEKSYCFGFLKTTDTKILLLLNRFLESMEEDEVYTNMMQHIADGNKNMDILCYLRKNPEIIFWTVFVLIMFAIAVAIYFVKSKQEQRLLRAKNEAQTRFLSNMSHEMRTPLNTIIGLNGLAKDNMADTHYVEECVQKIDVASNHLLQLINDILDMSKIGEGKMRLQEKTFDLIAMLQSIDTIYQLNAQEKHVKLLTEIDYDIERYVKMDELRLKQVIINLLLNGIKYNRIGGEVLIQAQLVSKVEGVSQEVCFSVIDTGCGILEENRKKIFNAFEREERNDMEDVKGTGLGLAISSEIVKMMHSELKLETKVDEGSKFTFTVTIPNASKQEITEILPKSSAETTEISYEGMHFLLFEDNEINATIVKKILESKGGEVTYAVNGKLGCELFKQSQAGYFDIILMDIRMPLMDGYDATVYIRSLEREDAKTIPIFALSANAFSEDVEKSKQVGMNEHLAKPLDKDKLFEMIARYRT